jgi:uncharacterized protein (DUF169 family)
MEEYPMTDYSILEHSLCEILSLPRRPVAVTFRLTPPIGVAKFAGSEPSGCSFWQLAAGGMTFYTVPGDHCNCAVGSYTHNFPLPPERKEEFEKALSIMSSSGYIKMEELNAIPRLKEAPKAIVYSPLGNTPEDPDMVILVARPLQIMMLQESAMRSGVGLQLSLFGGATCMSLPSSLGQHGMITSAGCIGNRVYNALGEDELYVIFPGSVLKKIVDEMHGIAESTARKVEYHKGRRKSLAVPQD